MSEGEGGYKPPLVDNTTSRRAFLKDMLKVGAGIAAVTAGIETLPGQKPVSVEAAPLEAQGPKVVLLDISTANEKPIGVQFQMLKDLNGIKPEDIVNAQKAPIEALASTSISFAQRMIDMEMHDQHISDVQKEQITQVIIDFQTKLDHILSQSNTGNKHKR